MSVKIKIIHINSTYEYGSTGRIAMELSNYINQSDIGDCYTFYSKGNIENKFTKRIGNDLDTKIHAFLSRITGLQGYFSCIPTKRLVKKMEIINPDIILLSNLHGNFLCYKEIFKYARRHNKHVVLILHDCWFYTGKCCHYTVAKCDKWTNTCGKCIKLHDDNNSWFFDFTKFLLKSKKNNYESIKDNLHVIGVSKWITNEAKKSILSCAKNVCTIYNWIDLEAFNKEAKATVDVKLNILPKKYVISVASIWNNCKGLNKICELAEECKDINFLLVGKKPKRLEGTIPSNILFYGEVFNPKHLAYLYKTAAVYINLSEEETFGKVSAEAISCGTPVICLDSTANKEIVGPGCGICLEKYDAKEFSKYIYQILENGKEKYSKHCVEFSKNNFSRETQLIKYINFFKKILKIEL